MELIKAKQFSKKEAQKKDFFLSVCQIVVQKKIEEEKRVKKMDNSSDTTFSSTDHPSSVALLPAQAGEGSE